MGEHPLWHQRERPADQINSFPVLLLASQRSQCMTPQISPSSFLLSNKDNFRTGVESVRIDLNEGCDVVGEGDVGTEMSKIEERRGREEEARGVVVCSTGWESGEEVGGESDAVEGCGSAERGDEGLRKEVRSCSRYMRVFGLRLNSPARSWRRSRRRQHEELHIASFVSLVSAMCSAEDSQPKT